jgi:DNA-directed RNA polymerase subunit M/transcription elongation factor TFIIS
MKIEKKISYIALQSIMSISNLFSIDRESFHDKQQEMEHTCQQCGNKFSKKSLLLKHQRDLGHHESYDCEICRKTIGRKYNIDRHMVRHRDESLHQCSECGFLLRRYHNQVGRGLKRKCENVNETPVKRRLTKIRLAK